MPSIANQDFKIYGLLQDSPIMGIPGIYCGELYAAVARAHDSKSSYCAIADCFALDGDITPTRMSSYGVYYDIVTEEWKSVSGSHNTNPDYYDALWAIQQAYFAFNGSTAWNGSKFNIGVNGQFGESGNIDQPLINEDGYLICGTAQYGKLASLYLGEKVEHPEGYAVVRLESLLPLVGELPLNTTEIW